MGGVKFVITKLIPDPKADEKNSDKSGRQTKDIDSSKNGIDQNFSED
jgi:hypothetical protein